MILGTILIAEGQCRCNPIDHLGEGSSTEESVSVATPVIGIASGDSGFTEESVSVVIPSIVKG